MSKQNFIDKGEIEITEADDANIPVVCYLLEPDETSNKWRWIASNFMPRKGRVAEDSYRIEAESKEAILEALNKHVVPLYEVALKNLKETGTNYYWAPETTE